MTLTLKIRNVDMLDHGMPPEFVLHRRGGVIGRSPSCDWCLPDPRNHISSRHCEIRYSDNCYVLTDVSTNGTFLNDASERLAGPHRVEHGDRLQIGHYEIVAALSGSAAVADERGADSGSASAAKDGWFDAAGAARGSDSVGGWDASPPAAAAPADGFRWGDPPQPPPRAAQGGGWAPSHRVPDAAPVSTWETPAAQQDPPSPWSSAAPDRPPPPRAADVWGRIAEGNVVDWARGGFGQPADQPTDPLGLDLGAEFGWLPQPPATPAVPAEPPPSAPFPEPRPRPAPTAAAPAAAAPAAVAPAADGERLLALLLGAARLDRQEISGPPEQLAGRIGSLLTRLVAGLVVMLEARARAKSQMGAEATSFGYQGNNPIKFARTPEQALAQLIGPPQPGFMEADRAVEDAFYDLQSHQMATLKAMQGALKATLERFSPNAIRGRAAEGGLARLLPVARKAALWDSYEREFGGVAQGSDEAFMDVFAKEFRKAYEEQSRLQVRR